MPVDDYLTSEDVHGFNRRIVRDALANPGLPVLVHRPGRRGLHGGRGRLRTDHRLLDGIPQRRRMSRCMWSPTASPGCSCGGVDAAHAVA